MKNITIVTGGNSGLGYSISKLLVKQGLNVCIIGRNKDSLMETKKALSEINSKVEVIFKKGTIADEKFVESIYKELMDTGYNVDCLFNNAGVGRIWSC